MNMNTKNSNDINFGLEFYNLANEFKEQVAFFLAIELTKTTNIKWSTKSPLLDVLVYTEEDSTICVAISELSTNPHELAIRFFNEKIDPMSLNYFTFSVDTNNTASTVAKNVFEKLPFEKLPKNP